MSRYRFSEKAREDLKSIWRYIEKDAGPDVADGVLDDIFDAIEVLADRPGVGHQHEFLTDPLVRVWVIHSYLIVYWPEDVPLGIARVIHGRRDLGVIETPRP